MEGEAAEGSLWPRPAELPLVVASCRYERLEPGPGFGEARANRLACLAGEGGEGLGEDITLFIAEAPELALAQASAASSATRDHASSSTPTWAGRRGS